MLDIFSVNSFYGKAQVLNNMSFNIQRGQVVALLGRNGAGKTTTLKSIMQLVIPRTGKVKFLIKILPVRCRIRLQKWALAMCPKNAVFLLI
jgi:ABC-type multidrug transport system ATPase subunit